MSNMGLSSTTAAIGTDWLSSDDSIAIATQNGYKIYNADRVIEVSEKKLSCEFKKPTKEDSMQLFVTNTLDHMAKYTTGKRDRRWPILEQCAHSDIEYIREASLQHMKTIVSSLDPEASKH